MSDLWNNSLPSIMFAFSLCLISSASYVQLKLLYSMKVKVKLSKGPKGFIKRGWICLYRLIVHGISFLMALFEFTCLCTTLSPFQDLYFTQIYLALRNLKSKSTGDYHFITKSCKKLLAVGRSVNKALTTLQKVWMS